MYKLCKTEQSTKRQREIELSLQKMMLQRRYDDITVSDLCEQIGIPRKAFYRYFESKDGALHALIDHTLMEFGEFGSAYTEKERRTLARDLEQFYLFWTKHKNLLDALERNNLMGLLISTSVSSTVNELVNPEKFLPEDSDWMRSEVFLFAISGLMASMLAWYRQGFKTDTKEMARAACRMLSRPLFPTIGELGLSD